MPTSDIRKCTSISLVYCTRILEINLYSENVSDFAERVDQSFRLLVSKLHFVFRWSNNIQTYIPVLHGRKTSQGCTAG